MNDVLMRNHEHSPCTTCHRQACEGCPEQGSGALIVGLGKLCEQYREGACPSCKHPQHVGRTCGHEVTTYRESQELGLPGNVTVPVRCPCSAADAIKQTKGKVKGWRMFPWEVMGEILGIFQYGIEKGYLKDSWRKVDPEKYEEALMRHATAHLRGEIRDPESGKRHIAHAAWNTIVLLVLSPASSAPVEYDRSIHSNPDAAAWAKFFAETFPAGSPVPSETTMLGWFANAMMAMHDHLKRK